ncbi:MAG: indolepyruvate oxidoreductase subunit beta [Saccharofermentanales bacterium]
MSDQINIVIVGVGGQGTLVAGKLFGAVAMKLGLDVKVSEIHGMSQRGGSVVTYVRVGEKVFSPVVEKGSADFVIAFEELEALRCAGFLAESGKLVVNRKNVVPVTVKIGKGIYPDGIPDKLKAAAGDKAEVISIDAEDIALDIGNVRTVNMVMIGALSAYTDIDCSIWESAVDEVFPDRLRVLNKAAFHKGRDYVLLPKIG